jgi:hypothetical protein
MHYDVTTLSSEIARLQNARSVIASSGEAKRPGRPAKSAPSTVPAPKKRTSVCLTPCLREYSDQVLAAFDGGASFTIDRGVAPLAQACHGRLQSGQKKLPSRATIRPARQKGYGYAPTFREMQPATRAGNCARCFLPKSHRSRSTRIDFP